METTMFIVGIAAATLLMVGAQFAGLSHRFMRGTGVVLVGVGLIGLLVLLAWLIPFAFRNFY